HAADAGVEALLAAVVAVATVVLEQALPALGERHNAVTGIHGHEPDESLVSKMRQAVLASIRHLALRNDAEGADRRQRPDILAIELVPFPSLEHQVTALAAWQVEVCCEDVARVRGPVVRLSLAVSRVQVSLARVAVATAC